MKGKRTPALDQRDYSITRDCYRCRDAAFVRRELRIRKERTLDSIAASSASASALDDTCCIMECKETVRGMARPEGRIGLGDRSLERIAAGKRAMRILHLE